MSCPGCLIALAGFGDDAVTAGGTPMPAMVGGPAINPQMIDSPLTSHVGTAVLNSLAYVIGGPIVGALAFSIIGAVAYRDHRFAGGALGFLAGGAIGGIIGAYLAKRKVESVLPELQGAVAAAVDSTPDAVSPDGTMDVPSGGWSVGPLVVPSGKLSLPGLIPGQLSVSPSHLIGMLNLTIVQAAKQGQQVPNIKRVPAPSGQKIPHIKGVPATSAGQAIQDAVGTANSAQQAIQGIVAVLGQAAASSGQKIIPNIKGVPAPAGGGKQIPHIVGTTTNSKGQKVPNIVGVPAPAPSCFDACSAKFNFVSDNSNWNLCASKCVPTPNRDCLDSCSLTYNMITQSADWNNCVGGCYYATPAPATPGKQIPNIKASAPASSTPSSSGVTILTPGQSMSTAQTGCPAGTMRNANGVCASPMQGAMTTPVQTIGQPSASTPVAQLFPKAQAIVAPSAASSIPMYQ